MVSLKRLTGVISIAMMAVGAIAMTLMMVHIVADGLVRTLFSASVPGTMELSSFYYMIAVTFLPLAYIHAGRGHVIIELFTSGLSPRTVYGIESAVGFLLALGAGWFAYATTWKAMMMTTAGEFVVGMLVVPTWQTRWVVVAGVGMLAVVALLEAIDDLAVVIGNRSVEEGNRHRARQKAWLDRAFGLEADAGEH